jgi:hypothetical protein
LLRPPPDYARDFLFWAWLKIKLRLACRFGRQGPQFQHRGLHLVWSGSFLAFSLLRLRYFGVAVCAVRLVLGFWAGMDEQSLGPISSCWKLLGSIVCWYSYWYTGIGDLPDRDILLMLVLVYGLTWSWNGILRWFYSFPIRTLLSCCFVSTKLLSWTNIGHMVKIMRS